MFNDDPTAARLHELLTDNGVVLDKVLLWNAVPLWLSSASAGGSFRTPTSADLHAAAPWFGRVPSLLPPFRVIVPLGRKADRGLSIFAVK